MDHLSVLELRLSNERLRLSKATTEHERALRGVWVEQIKKEIADEQSLLQARMQTCTLETLDIDDLFNELFE